MTIEAYLRQIDARRRRLRCKRWDIRVCVSPWWHRKYWYHAGGQTYYCEICERLSTWLAWCG